MNRYYITFGSDEAFPFPNSYIVVEAENERKANELFQKHYPNRPGSDCLNYAFMYTEREWANVRYYYPNPPSTVLSYPSPVVIEVELDEKAVSEPSSVKIGDCRLGFVINDCMAPTFDAEKSGQFVDIPFDIRNLSCVVKDNGKVLLTGEIRIAKNCTFQKGLMSAKLLSKTAEIVTLDIEDEHCKVYPDILAVRFKEGDKSFEVDPIVLHTYNFVSLPFVEVER